jgi:hypothetical protein
MIESGAGASSALVYWLANPVLNPAALVFIGLVLGWQWAALRLVVGAALVFVVGEVAGRFVSPGWRLPAVSGAVDGVERNFLIAWGSAFMRLAVRLVPEYVVLVFALGMARAWFFPAGHRPRRLACSGAGCCRNAFCHSHRRGISLTASDQSGPPVPTQNP